jgi:hypothetical protein
MKEKHTMTTAHDTAALIAGPGGKTAKFATIGDTHEGVIESKDVRQRKDFQTQEPLEWNDGSPQLEIVVALATSERADDDPDDDGVRKLYLKTWGQTMQELRRAVKAAGADDIEVGGHLKITYARDGEIKTRGFNAPKEFAMEYRKPSGTAGLINNGGQETPVEPTRQTGQTQQAQAPAEPEQGSQPADQVAVAKKLIASGLDDQVIHGTTGLDLQVIAALRNAS